jgi:hypothetical protein
VLLGRCHCCWRLDQPCHLHPRGDQQAVSRLVGTGPLWVSDDRKVALTSAGADLLEGRQGGLFEQVDSAPRAPPGVPVEEVASRLKRRSVIRPPASNACRVDAEITGGPSGGGGCPSRLRTASAPSRRIRQARKAVTLSFCHHEILRYGDADLRVQLHVAEFETGAGRISGLSDRLGHAALWDHAGHLPGRDHADSQAAGRLNRFAPTDNG